MLGRNDYWPVLAMSRTMTTRAGLAIAEDKPSLNYLRRTLMRAFVELHEAAIARLASEADYAPKDSAMREVPEALEVKPSGRSMEELVTAYETDKAPGGADRARRRWRRPRR